MVLVIAIGMLCGVLIALADPVTKYDGAIGVATSSAAVTFAPSSGKIVVKSVSAASDKLASQVKFYARPSTVAKYAPLTVPDISATVIHLSHTAALTNSDSVVYVHANGTVDYTTISSSANATNVTLASGISIAGAAGDYLYKVTQQGAILLGIPGTGYGTNQTINLAGDLFATPGDSPLYVVVDGTSNALLQVTIDRP